MNPSILRLAALAAAAGVAASAPATDDDLRSLAGMTGHNRVLLVFAPNLADPRLAAQRRSFAHMGAEAQNRDLLLVQVADGKVIGAHDAADKLRRRFAIQGQSYRTLLIGKDGHVALDRPAPIDDRALKQAIDAMPMRRDEMRRAAPGGR